MGEWRLTVENRCPVRGIPAPVTPAIVASNVHAVTLHVDGDRLVRRLDELAAIGAVEGSNGERGCARLALTDEDAMLKEWPELLAKFGPAIGDWRQASKQKNAVVHF